MVCGDLIGTALESFCGYGRAGIAAACGAAVRYLARDAFGFYFDFNTEEKLTVMFSIKVIMRQWNATDLQPKTDRKTEKYLTAEERR